MDPSQKKTVRYWFPALIASTNTIKPGDYSDPTATDKGKDYLHVRFAIDWRPFHKKNNTNIVLSGNTRFEVKQTIERLKQNSSYLTLLIVPHKDL
jgi:hypothetical protein